MVEAPCGRRARQHAADVRQHRARDARIVEAGVFEEARVFDRDERVLHVIGNLLDRHEHALLARELGNQRAVAGVNAAGDRRLIVLQIGEAGQADDRGDDQRDDRKQSRRPRAMPKPISTLRQIGGRDADRDNRRRRNRRLSRDRARIVGRRGRPAALSPASCALESPPASPSNAARLRPAASVSC